MELPTPPSARLRGDLSSPLPAMWLFKCPIPHYALAANLDGVHVAGNRCTVGLAQYNLRCSLY